MRAMALTKRGEPLSLEELSEPEPGPDQIRVRVEACGVCRTDLHVADGELPDPKLPLVLGHQIVGAVDAVGADVEGIEPGGRVGIPWLGWTDGECRYCRSGRENLCYRALRMTGDAEQLGLYGFGASAHLIAQVAVWEGRRVFAFTRAGDDEGQGFARSLGAAWAGASEETPPDE